MELSMVTTSLSEVLKWVGLVVTSLVSETGELHDLLNFFLLSVGISGLFVGFKVLKGVTWGA